MVDPLSLLRQYNMNKREMVQMKNFIYFGEYCWPKDSKTNYLVYGSPREGPKREYYTLESLFFFIMNYTLEPQVYVNRAEADNIQTVRMADRRDLLAYLFGETDKSENIDKNPESE